jgi:hypothetical protein
VLSAQWGQQQALDGAAAWHPMAQQAGGKDSRVIRDEQISGPEE